MHSRRNHLRRFFVSLTGIFLCLAGIIRVRAQDLRYLSHQSWSTEEGLPQSSVHSIAQTTDGYIWAATESGLVRFDGIHLEVFNGRNTPAFTSSDICCLLPDSSGGLWIGTRDGLLHFTAGRFQRFGEVDGLPSPDILTLSATTNGELAVATTAGDKLWRTAHIASNSIPNTSRRWRWSPQDVSFQSSASSRRWRTGADLPQGRILAFWADRSGIAWVGMSSGLVTIDPATGLIQSIPAFAGSSVLSLWQDAEGNQWVGTESSGLHILRREEFRSISSLSEKPITSVAQTSSGDIWIGTRDEGLFRIHRGFVDQPIAPTRLTSPVILCLQPASDGSLWVGTPDGLSHISTSNKVTKVTSAEGLTDDYIRSLAESADGTLWVGTRHGLSRVIPSAHNSILPISGLNAGLIGSLFYQSSLSALWVATPVGLTLLDPKGKIRNFTAADGLPATIITALTEDAQGRLWAGSEDGIVLLFDGRRFLPILHLPLDGVSNNGLQALSFDFGGSLWIRMNRGIFRIRSNALQACISHTTCDETEPGIVRFGAAQGLHNDEIVPTSMASPWLDRDGALWFPTRAGIAITDPRASSGNTTSPPVVIQQLMMDESPINISDGMPQIQFGHGRISIDYAGLSYIAPADLQFRYRLVGFDRDWKYVGNRRSASYTNLSPGNYNFEVQARNNEGPWSSNATQLVFHIVPPIYRRWWFLLVSSLLLMGAIVSLYLLRLHRLRRRFDVVLAERNRMAREIHDTLTQDFVSTSLQLDIIAQQLRRGHLEQAIEQVKRARQLVTEGLTEARQSIWELRSNPSQETLPTRLLHLTQRETFADMRPALEVRGAYRALQPRIEREILRITSEALTNIRNHAAAQHTQVVLYYSSETIMLTVTDDGAGFDVKTLSHREGHYGLVGMKERASSVDATLDIVSSQGKGTTVTLRVPLTSDSDAPQEAH